MSQSSAVRWQQVETGRRYTKFQAPGDQVEGVVLAAETRPSKFEGKIERVLTIEKIDGSVTLVSCPTDLARKAEVLKIGDVVRITFVEFKPVDAGLMKVFSVGVAVQDMQPDDRGGDDSVPDDGAEPSPFSRHA